MNISIFSKEIYFRLCINQILATSGWDKIYQNGGSCMLFYVLECRLLIYDGLCTELVLISDGWLVKLTKSC